MRPRPQRIVGRIRCPHHPGQDLGLFHPRPPVCLRWAGGSGRSPIARMNMRRWLMSFTTYSMMILAISSIALMMPSWTAWAELESVEPIWARRTAWWNGPDPALPWRSTRRSTQRSIPFSRAWLPRAVNTWPICVRGEPLRSRRARRWGSWWMSTLKRWRSWLRKRSRPSTPQRRAPREGSITGSMSICRRS